MCERESVYPLAFSFYLTRLRRRRGPQVKEEPAEGPGNRSGRGSLLGCFSSFIGLPSNRAAILNGSAHGPSAPPTAATITHAPRGQSNNWQLTDSRLRLGSYSALATTGCRGISAPDGGNQPRLATRQKSTRKKKSSPQTQFSVWNKNTPTRPQKKRIQTFHFRVLLPLHFQLPKEMREASPDDKNPLKRRRGIRKIGPAVQVHSFELDSGVLERHADDYFSAGNKRIETFTTVQCPLFHVHLLHLCKSVREEQFVQSSGLHLNTFTCFNEDNSQTPPPLTFPVEKLKINRLNGLATRKQINQFRRLKVSNFRRRLFPSRRSSTTITLCWMAGSYSACSDCVFFGDQSQPKPMEN